MSMKFKDAQQNLKRVEWVEVEQISKNKTKEELKAPINY